MTLCFLEHPVIKRVLITAPRPSLFPGQKTRSVKFHSFGVKLTREVSNFTCEVSHSRNQGKHDTLSDTLKTL